MVRTMIGGPRKETALWLVLALGLNIAGGCGKNGKGAPPGRGPSVLKAVIVPADAKPGARLECRTEAQSRGGLSTTLTYQWERNGGAIPGATDNALETKGFKKGDVITVRITLRDSLGEGPVFRTPQIKLRNSPPEIIRITLGPRNPTAGQDLTAVVETLDGDGEPVSVRFRWWKGGQEIPGVSGPILAGTMLRRGDEVTVSAIPKDSEEEGKEAKAISTTVMGRPPVIESSPPGEAPSGGTFSYQVRGRDQDGGNISYSLISGPAGMTLDPTTGLLNWTLPGGRGGVYPVTVRVTTVDGAFVEQGFTIRY